LSPKHSSGIGTSDDEDGRVVLVLSLRQPAGCLGGFGVVDDDLLPGRIVRVDLLEQLLDEMLGGDLQDASAAGIGAESVNVALRRNNEFTTSAF
jgi:hypothetical protein